MKRTLLLITLATTLATSPLAALAASPSTPVDKRRPPCDEPALRDEGPGGPFERLADILDLSDEQRRQIEEIRSAERTRTEEFRRQHDEARDAIEKLTSSAKFDESAVRTLAGKQSAAATELIVAQARTRNQIYALLTPEQRQLAERIGTGAGKRGGERRGGGKGR